MAREDRNGNQRGRRSDFPRKIRRSNLFHYLIFTDTKETEKNYFHGLQSSLPKEQQDRIHIKVLYAKTQDLVTACRENYVDNMTEKWIVLDRDEVENFDELVERAEKAGIHVGWSNPCIETWFSAYFGTILNAADSVSCCSSFRDLFYQKTGREYRKNQEDLYATLTQYGDETAAVKRAGQRLNTLRTGKEKPSELISCTTLYELVGEIRKKRVNT